MTKAGRILTNVVAFVLGAGTCLGVCTAGFRDWSSLKKTANKVEQAYNGMVANVASSNGFSLAIASAAEVGEVSAQAENSYTITATVNGEGTFDNTLTWAIAFANPSSEWATGKVVEDYVTMTVGADTDSVTLENKAAFGEQIVVTATSVDNPAKSASCHLDYLKRLEGVSSLKKEEVVVVVDPEQENFGDVTLVVNDEGREAYTEMSGVLNFGVGTIVPDVDIKTMRLTGGDATWTELADETNAPMFHWDFLYLDIRNFEIDGNAFLLDTALELEVFDLPSSEEYLYSNSLHNAFRRIANNAVFGGFEMVFTFACEGVTYGEVEFNLPQITSGNVSAPPTISTSFVNYRVSAESVELDTESVVF